MTFTLIDWYIKRSAIAILMSDLCNDSGLLGGYSYEQGSTKNYILLTHMALYEHEHEVL